MSDAIILVLEISVEHQNSMQSFNQARPNSDLMFKERRESELHCDSGGFPDTHTSLWACLSHGKKVRSLERPLAVALIATVELLWDAEIVKRQILLRSPIYLGRGFWFKPFRRWFNLGRTWFSIGSNKTERRVICRQALDHLISSNALAETKSRGIPQLGWRRERVTVSGFPFMDSYLSS